MKSVDSKLLLGLVVGAAVGAAVGYLAATDTGRIERCCRKSKRRF